MGDSDSEQIKPPPEPSLFKILCCPADTKIGQGIVEKLWYPYENNDEDSNIILGKFQMSNSKVQNQEKGKITCQRV